MIAISALVIGACSIIGLSLCFRQIESRIEYLSKGEVNINDIDLLLFLWVALFLLSLTGIFVTLMLVFTLLP